MANRPWELREVGLDASGLPNGDVFARRLSNATNPLEAIEEAWQRMLQHGVNGFPVECVVVADSGGKLVAAVTKRDIIEQAGTDSPEPNPVQNS